MVGVAVRVAVSVLVGVGVAVLVEVGVAVNVAVGVLVGVLVAVGSGVRVGPGVYGLIQFVIGLLPSFSIVRAERMFTLMPFGAKTLKNGTIKSNR